MVKINSHVTKQGATNTRLVKQIAQEEAAATLTRLGSDHGGLKTDQVDQARAAYGPNRIEGHRKDSRLRFLAEAFLTPFTIVLLFLATLSLFANYIFVPAPQKDLSTVIIMVVMVLISGLTSFVQNVRTSNAVDKLLSLVSVNATVMRDGREEEIATSEVVVGDVVVLSAGDMVPADLRLLTTRDLFCSSSSLNGESTPVEKDATSKPQDLDDYLSYPNVLYEGTTVVSGSGTGVVFATGDSTVFGRLAREISQEGVKQTAFDKGMKDISRLLITMTLILAPVVFLINGLTKGNWLDALIFAIATAVGLTPEMLPVIVTSNLVKGSVEMSKHGTIVKKMNSIQNFGSADVLCTDKTGTLTQDKVVLERHYNLDLHETPRILELAYLNSFYQTGMQDLMDKAIVQAAQEELDVSRIQKDHVKIDEVPFDFTRRRMSVVVQKSDGEYVLVTKGAAEEMLAACDRTEIDGRVEALTDKRRKKVLADIEEMNEDGLRVILIGYKSDNEPAGSATAADEDDLILVGYLAFLDPPKESTREALQDLESDGIKVKILTGDNAAVTKAVCKRVGLPAAKVYTGSQLEEASEDELAGMVEECDIFVKLSPELKTRIITALKAKGHIVGYMGDGINDAPAMKAADVSVSVDTAVDIAKESADIILLHKDLRILENAVRIGRKVFGNTMKYIKITLSSNFGNILSILVASCFLPFLPMLPLQLLVLDLLYGTSCLSIPLDSMPDSYVKTPRAWTTKKLPKFMFCFGPASSLFDVITFALLYFCVCPAIMGGSFTGLSPAGQMGFMVAFHTGWFIESLWTQEMVIHALRDRGIPFIQQRATTPVLVATIGAAAFGTCLLYIPAVARLLKFTLLPAGYLLLVALLLVCYIAVTSLVKSFYLRTEKFLI